VRATAHCRPSLTDHERTLPSSPALYTCSRTHACSELVVSLPSARWEDDATVEGEAGAEEVEEEEGDVEAEDEEDVEVKDEEDVEVKDEEDEEEQAEEAEEAEDEDELSSDSSAAVATLALVAARSVVSSGSARIIGGG
jgi:hypothetical protein